MIKVLIPSIILTWYLTPSNVEGQIWIRNFFECAFVWISFIFLYTLVEEA